MQLRGFVLGFALLVTACSEPSDRDLHRLVEAVMAGDGELSRKAAEALIAEGPRSIVILETGLYTDDPAARSRIVRTLAAYESDQVIAILEFVARRDDDETVRAAAKRALSRR